MKFEVSSKKIKNFYSHIFKCGYCNLTYLLRDLEPFGYSKGVYGWNCDYFYLGNGICICTGYRNLIGDSIPRDICVKYEEKARKISNTFSYLESCQHLKKLRLQFINELLGVE